MQKCKLIQKNMTVRKKKKYISNLKIKNKKGIFTKKSHLIKWDIDIINVK